MLCLLYFWANTLASLNRFPRIHEDEAWIAAPGIHFWSAEGFGTFGTPLFSGFYGMEQRYYGFMPLLPLLTGLSVRFFGMGLFQIRLVPLFASILTLGLTYRLAAILFSRWHGVLAIFILIGWKIAAPALYFATGIPMADMARLTRYDNLVPVFGLAGMLLALGTKPSSLIKRRRGADAMAGFCVGLAALSHVYGAFWLLPLLIIRRRIVICVGFVAAMLPYALFVAAELPAFIHQQANNSGRFQLTDSTFYQQNLLNEAQRYQPIIEAASHGSIGAALWLLGVLLGVCVLIARRERTLSWMLLTQVAGFALLLKPKTPMYLTTLLPLFALVIVVGGAAVWRTTWSRPLLIAAFILAFTEGTLSTQQMHDEAAQTTPYLSFTDAIARHLPPESRLVAMQHYWLGLADDVADYRSILVPMWLTNPQFVPHPRAFSDAMQDIAPNIVLVDEVLLQFLREARATEHPYHMLAQAIQDYFRHGTVIARISDVTYGRVLVYQFQPP